MADRTGRKTATERFHAKIVTDENGCWVWTGGRNNDGYGSFWCGEKRLNGTPIMVLAHRWAYEEFIGPIPVGNSVCHHCDIPACVNPEHLFVGTQSDNMKDCSQKGRWGAVRTHAPPKLGISQRSEIRNRYRGTWGEIEVLAGEYGVSPSLIGQIIGGRAAWKATAIQAARNLRDQGESQGQIAIRLGVAQATVSRWLSSR